MQVSDGFRLNSKGSEVGSGESEEDGVAERWIPMTWRMARTMPLKMEMERAVFTRSTHSTPSDGAGRLDSPMLLQIGVLGFRFAEKEGLIWKTINRDVKTLYQRPKTEENESEIQNKRLADLQIKITQELALEIKDEPCNPVNGGTDMIRALIKIKRNEVSKSTVIRKREKKKKPKPQAARNRNKVRMEEQRNTNPFSKTKHNPTKNVPQSDEKTPPW